MLHINGLTYRLGERLLIDGATAALPSGARVGLVGRNGAGKTTLFRLIRGELSPESGLDHRSQGRAARQRRAGGAGRGGDADRLRAFGRRRALGAVRRGRERQRPRADRRNPDPTRRHRRPRGAGARGADPQRPRLRRGGAEPGALRIFRGLADAGRARGGAVLRARHPAARRADQLPRPRGRAVAHRLSQELSVDGRRHQPRPRPARRRRRPHPPSRPRQAHALERRLYELRAPAPRTAGAAGQDAEEAGGAARAPAGLRRSLPRQRHQGDPGPVAPQDARQDGADRGDRRRDRHAVQMAAGRQKAQPADRDDGEGQRRLRRPRRALAARPHPLQRRPRSGCSAPTATASRPSPS